MKSLAAACFVLICAAGASADVLYPAALTLEPGYASGPPIGFPWWAGPDYGDPLTIVGRVAEVRPPFDDLLPAGAYELTYVFEGSSCTELGNWDDFNCNVGGIYGIFQGGTVAFYLDTSPDADFTTPQTFRDGDLVLRAQSSFLFAHDNDGNWLPYCPDVPDIDVYFAFVDGAWFSRVSNQSVGFEGTDRGQLDNNVTPELQSLGYIVRVDGVIDINGPVAVEPMTWGRVKALYR